MKYLGWIVATVLLCSMLVAQGTDQKKGSDLTWDELKRQQNAERSDFLGAQKESLTKVLEEQRTAMEAMRGNSPTDSMLLNLSNQHGAERKEIIKAQSDERAKEADVWASERKSYKNGG